MNGLLIATWALGSIACVIELARARTVRAERIQAAINRHPAGKGRVR